MLALLALAARATPCDEVLALAADGLPLAVLLDAVDARAWELSLAWFPRPAVGLELRGGLGPRSMPFPGYPSLVQVDVDPLPGRPTHDVRGLAAASLVLAPLAGELEAGRRSCAVRGYLVTGFALAGTSDLYAFAPVPPAWRPAAIYGGGVRIATSRAIGLRLQADDLVWIEPVDGAAETLHRPAVSAALTFHLA